eukprot:850716-Prymnesium_polylepis.2
MLRRPRRIGRTEMRNTCLNEPGRRARAVEAETGHERPVQLYLLIIPSGAADDFASGRSHSISQVTHCTHHLGATRLPLVQRLAVRRGKLHGDRPHSLLEYFGRHALD